jgi:hypothetical protein
MLYTQYCTEAEFLDVIRTKVFLLAVHSHLYYGFYVTDGNIMYPTDASRFLISCVIQHYAPVVGWGGGGGTDA